MLKKQIEKSTIEVLTQKIGDIHPDINVLTVNKDDLISVLVDGKEVFKK